MTTQVIGQTNAGKTLQADVVRSLSYRTRAANGCRKVDAVEVTPIRINQPGTGDSAAARQYGSVEERWVFTACGESTPYRILFTPDGAGGTFFRTSPER